MSDEAVDINMNGLDQLIKALKHDAFVKVGILGESSESRRENAAKSGNKFKGGALSVKGNAEIGLKHEMGSPKDHLPVRSFLRMPLATHLQDKLDESKFFDEDVLKKMVKAGTPEYFLNKLGAAAVSVVLEAFDSGGFGEWPAHKPGYENNTGMILVDTTQLRNSVSWEI